MMASLRKLRYVAAKDLLIIAKDRGSWMTLLVTPLVVIVVTSFALAPVYRGGSLHATLLVTNNDRGSIGRSLVDTLKTNANMSVQPASEAESQTLKRGGSTYALSLVIPADFSSRVMAGQSSALTVYEDPNSTTSGPFLKGMLDGTVNRFSAVEVATRVAVAEAQKANPAARTAAVAGNASAAATAQMADQPIKTDVRTASGLKTLNTFDIQTPGFAVMFLLFGVMIGAEGLLEERDKGTLGRLLVAPISKTSIMGGKLAAQFAVSISQITLLFAIGHFAFGMDLGNSLPGLALMVAMTAFTATTFGLLLAAIARTRRQASAIGILTILLMSALGGSWWPLDIVPDFMQKLGHITINAWALDGIRGLILHGEGFSDILPQAGVLFIYGSVCFIIGIKMFRFRNA